MLMTMLLLLDLKPNLKFFEGRHRKNKQLQKYGRPAFTSKKRSGHDLDASPQWFPLQLASVVQQVLRLLYLEVCVGNVPTGQRPVPGHWLGFSLPAAMVTWQE